jgi:F-type H+-transporting ATPase subunit delta
VTDRIDGYANAVFEMAQAEGLLARVEQEFYAVARSIERSPELREALTDPRLPSDRKQSIVDDLVGGRASELTVNLVGLVVSQGRAGDLPAIAERLSARSVASEGKALAEVRSAIELDAQTLDRLTAAISRKLGRHVEVRAVVDPSVLGGIVARVGDTVIDGSVARRLQSLRQTLKTR